MLYLVTQPDNEFSYQKMQNNSLRQYLKYYKISFREICLESTDCITNDTKNKIALSYSTPKDTWFITYAQYPVIDLISTKPGRKFAHIHGIEAFLYNPAVPLKYPQYQDTKLRMYDGIFVNSVWSHSLIAQSYPDIAHKTYISGFPINPRYFDPYRNITKIENLVIFNQRFSYKKLNILEAYLTDKLIGAGYRVMHLCSRCSYQELQNNIELRNMMNEYIKRGLELTVSSTERDYYEKLAHGSILITTAIWDTLSIETLEAIELGLIPIAPDTGPFKEYLHPDNLYRPYNVDDILSKVYARPVRPSNINKYYVNNVIKIYFEKMGLK